jgi:hypothetical protein
VQVLHIVMTCAWSPTPVVDGRPPDGPRRLGALKEKGLFGAGLATRPNSHPYGCRGLDPALARNLLCRVFARRTLGLKQPLDLVRIDLGQSF